MMRSIERMQPDDLLHEGEYTDDVHVFTTHRHACVPCAADASAQLYDGDTIRIESRFYMHTGFPIRIAPPLRRTFTWYPRSREPIEQHACH